MQLTFLFIITIGDQIKNHAIASQLQSAHMKECRQCLKAGGGGDTHS